MLKTIYAFLRKDLEDALRSSSLIFILLVPIILSLIFVNFIGDNAAFCSAGVCGCSESGLVQSLRSLGSCDILIDADEDKLKQLVKNGELTAYIRIPENFDQDLKEDSFPVLNVYINESSFAKASVVRESIRTALRNMAGQEIPADIRVEKTGKFEGSINLSFLPMWIVFACIGAMSVSSSILAEEIDSRTMNAVLLAPVSWTEILIGKISCGFILSSASALIMLIVCGRGNFSCISAVSLIVFGTLVFSVMGAVIGLLCRSQSVCGALNSAAYTLMVMPVSMADFNETMQKIAYFLPSWHLCEGLSKAVFNGASIFDLKLNFVCLSAFLILFLILGHFALKKMRTNF